MKTPRRPFLALVTFALASLACSLNVDTGGGSPVALTVIVVPATNTTQPQPAPLASATSGPDLPTLTPLPTVQPASPTADTLHFYVSGYVWHDKCAPVDGPIPSPLPAGCVLALGGGLSADGIRQAGEPGLGGVIVRIELNCNYGAFTAATDSNGFYTMTFTVPANAGVSKQLICLSVDALNPNNASILLPGGWTLPLTDSAVALFQLTIQVETQNTVNFGWDYQFE